MPKITKNEIWTYIDLRNEVFFQYSLNVLAKANELAKSIAGKTNAIIAVSKDSSSNSKIIPEIEAAEKCMDYGVDFVTILNSSQINQARPDITAIAMANLVKTCQPMVILFTLTDITRELASICAGICRAGLIADAIDLKIDNSAVVASCPSWGGEIMAELTFVDNTKTGFITVQPHSFQAKKIKGTPGEVKNVECGKLNGDNNLRLISRSLESDMQRKIEEARTVVVGGAGTGSIDGFKNVRKLSAALGGEIAATRPPVLWHWIEEERLIGQTGKTVRPELLFAIGTSGAIQFTAGIMEAKKIIAVNRDPNAAIFNIADLGIVADAGTFVPVLTEKVKQVVMRKLADERYEDGVVDTKNDFGIKMRKLRESHEWTVQSLAQATGQTPDFINQVENNEVVPSVSFLLRLSRALEVDPGTFLNEDEKVKMQNQRTQEFFKRTNNYFYRTLTPSAENEHLRVFIINIEPKQNFKPVAYKHEGEEFIFVLEGNLELTLGKKIIKLKPGESKHFNSEIPHKLKGLANETTKCLVVLYTP